MTGNIHSVALPQWLIEKIETGTPDEGRAAIATYLDTLEEDQRKMAVNLLVFVPGAPILMTPDINQLNRQIEEKNADMVRKLLDAWIASIAHEADQREEAQSSRAALSKADHLRTLLLKELINDSIEHKEWLSSIVVQAAKADSDIGTREKQRLQLQQALVDLYQNSEGEMVGAIAIAGFMIACAFIGGPAFIQAQGLFVLEPVQSSLTALAGAIPANMQSALFLTVNLSALGIIYFAHAASIAASDGKPQANNPQYLRAFAAHMMQQIRGPMVEKLVASMLGKQSGIDGVSPKDVAHMTNIARIALLSVAMAALYKAETGWLSGLDYVGMILDGKPKSEEERVLARELKGLLAELPQAMRIKVLEGLMSYMDTNPTIEALMKPSDAFSSAFLEVFNPNIRG